MNEGMIIEGEVESFCTLRCCYMLWNTAEGTATYTIELIKYIVLLFHQKNENCHLFFKKHPSVNGRFNYSVTY